jgi:hypothetical protein
VRRGGGEGALLRDRLRDGLVTVWSPRFGPPQLFSDYYSLQTLRFQGLGFERVGVFEGGGTRGVGTLHRARTGSAREVISKSFNRNVLH